MSLNLRDIVARLIVRFDKRASDQAESEAKGSLNRIGDTAKRIGGIIAAAFAVRQIIEWGRQAVQAATEADTAWRNLRGTVEALGQAWDRHEKRFKAAAQAFKDATIYDDDDFALAAQRFIAITGNHAQAINAVALAANVAARFHNGQLEPAIEAVSRAWTGQTRVLRQYGITTSDVNEGLRILAERSLGAAEERAASFAGQTAILAREQGNLREAMGNVLIAASDQGSVLQNLIGVIEALTRWIEANQQTIVAWLNGGINVAVTVLRGFKTALEEIGDALVLVSVGPWALATKATSLLARGYALVLSAASPFSATIRRHRDEVREFADDLSRAADEFFRFAASSDPRKYLTRNRAPSAPAGGGARGGDGGVNAEGGIFVTAPPSEEAAGKLKKPLVDAAHEARDAWDEFSEGVARGFEEAGAAANGFAAGIAAGIIGGVKQAAQFKAQEQIAEGVSKLAAGLWPPNPAALASAAKHFAAAALWSALGAGAGAVAGAVAGGSSGGGGSRSPSGTRDIGSKGAESAGGPVKITRIFIDGIDPQNPRHQQLSAEAIRLAAERGELYEIIPSHTGRRGAA